VDFLIQSRAESIIDYGAGDGQLIVEAFKAGLEPRRFVAYEPVDHYVDMMKSKLEEHGLSGRVEIVTDLTGLESQGFDCVTCLNVLEHMPQPERESFYAACERVLEPGGEIFIDVPVEIGPTLLVKAVGRMVLKGRESEYQLGDLLKASVGAVQFDPKRFDTSDHATWIQDHKGFDYRLFRQELEHQFEILDQFATPFKWLAPSLGNQEVCFRCRLPASGQRAVQPGNG
jgi:2-polyprenyl-3-methyl-5-hydroxy-6-metoxy-1,4-benzoquinol methylase